MPQIMVRTPWGPPVVYRFDQDVITIGRGETNDLMLLDPALSRSHAVLRRDGSGWCVSDLQSRNGTCVNGLRVDAVHPVRGGDEIAVGDVLLVFEGSTADPNLVTRDIMTAPWEVPGTGTSGPPVLVGHSPVIASVLATVEKVAKSQATVLLTGESGTGKELVARRIHWLSSRRERPFVVVNCPALPGGLLESELFGVERGVATGVEARTGRIEMADGGTLFLDEIGDLEIAAQAKLLRFLQERVIERVGGRRPLHVDVRLIAATNQDLAVAMQRGLFRRDLFFRLDVVRVHLPPLRERREDIPTLVEHLLARMRGPTVTVDDAAMAALQAHDYPGNVRELEHLLERARVMAENGVLGPADLPSGLGAAAPVEDAVSRACAADLYDSLVQGKADFWEDVQVPFLRRQVARDTVKKLVERAHVETGSYKGVARLFGIERQHKKLLDFLRHHDLGVEKQPSSREG